MLFDLNFDPQKESLADTYELMMSTCWKRRLYGEYKQVLIRLHKLGEWIPDADEGEKDLLYSQLGIMIQYRDILKKRLERINEEEPCDEEDT